VFGDD
jgi:hypothetical protein